MLLIGRYRVFWFWCPQEHYEFRHTIVWVGVFVGRYGINNKSAFFKDTNGRDVLKGDMGVQRSLRFDPQEIAQGSCGDAPTPVCLAEPETDQPAITTIPTEDVSSDFSIDVDRERWH